MEIKTPPRGDRRGRAVGAGGPTGSGEGGGVGAVTGADVGSARLHGGLRSLGCAWERGGERIKAANRLAGIAD